MPNLLENGFSTRVNEDLAGAPDQNIMQATVNLFADMGVKPATLLTSYNLKLDDKLKPDTTPPKSEITTVFVDKFGDTRT